MSQPHSVRASGGAVLRGCWPPLPATFRALPGDEMLAFYEQAETRRVISACAERRACGGISRRHHAGNAGRARPCNYPGQVSEDASLADVPWSSPFYLDERTDGRLRQDARFAIRTLRARPAFTLVAVPRSLSASARRLRSSASSTRKAAASTSLAAVRRLALV
jgi:hypothetical protein